jgi:hypothetical protein
VPQISPNGSGWTLYNALQHVGEVSVFDLAYWFSLTRQTKALLTSLEVEFRSVKMLFQQGGRLRFGLDVF